MEFLFFLLPSKAKATEIVYTSFGSSVNKHALKNWNSCAKVKDMLIIHVNYIQVSQDFGGKINSW